MKTVKILFCVAIMMLMSTLTSQLSYSRIISISATSNNTFTPANVTNAVVGDTIRWTRTGGSHTTTCDGQQGTVRPNGAAAWSAPLTSGSPTFTYVIAVAGTYNYICEPHAPSMSGVIIATLSSITQTTQIVNDYKLSQNYPNPFNPVTNINFSIPNSAKVVLTIYNGAGQEVETLLNENLTQGSYRVDWNAVNFTSGVYYYKIQAGEFAETRKMLLIK
ncbi:MAG: T9SS type A sorting domain-containing protein [bacterium]|nr:T9SS type A sorting domain-containing protein [bacterium]